MKTRGHGDKEIGRKEMEEIIDFLRYKMTIEQIMGISITKVIGKLNPPVDKTINEIKEYFSNPELLG